METKLFSFIKSKGLRIMDVSRASGFCYSIVHHHCTGVRKVSVNAAMRYEATLGISKSELRPDIWPKE